MENFNCKKCGSCFVKVKYIKEFGKGVLKCLCKNCGSTWTKTTGDNNG